MSSSLLGASLIAYFIASILYLTNLHIKQPRVAGYGTIAAVLGFGVQTARLIHTIAVGPEHSPFPTPQEAMFFLSWAISGAFLGILFWSRLPAVGALAMPLAVIALALMFRFREPTEEKFITSGWLSIHVYSIIMSLALFALAFCCAVFYLVQNWLLKEKRLKGMFRKLPPLDRVDHLAYHLAAVGFPMLTLGIVTGAVGVEHALVPARATAVRHLVAGVAWVMYAAYFISRTAAHWRGKRSNWILILGAVAIVLAVAVHRFIR